MVARTTGTGSGSPTPAAWLRSRLTCSVSELIRGNLDVGKITEAGVDAVGRLVSMREFLDDGARRMHALACGRRESDMLVGICNADQLIERQGRTV
jgi:hypothetical protein